MLGSPPIRYFYVLGSMHAMCGPSKSQFEITVGFSFLSRQISLTENVKSVGPSVLHGKEL